MLLELLATLFGFTPTYCLYELSFSQALTLIEVRNNREAREAEDLKKQTDKKTKPGQVDLSDNFDAEDPTTYPTVDQIKQVWRQAYGS